MVTLLSQYSFIDPDGANFIFVKIVFIHNNSHTPWAMARNSASALDLATTIYFLLRQVKRLPPTKVQYPEVDFLSITEPP